MLAQHVELQCKQNNNPTGSNTNSMRSYDGVLREWELLDHDMNIDGVGFHVAQSSSTCRLEHACCWEETGPEVVETPDFLESSRPCALALVKEYKVFEGVLEARRYPSHRRSHAVNCA